MWKIFNAHNAETTIDALVAAYPDLVAYDESGFVVDPTELTPHLAHAGYGSPDTRRILFWASEEDSINDDGARAVAKAIWAG